MGAGRYVLAVVSVVLLGIAAGAFVNHRGGSSYAIPIVLALCGMVAGITAWKLDKLVRGPSKSSKSEDAS
jgi:F0F1-type ATP synthase assembly protein I